MVSFTYSLVYAMKKSLFLPVFLGCILVTFSLASAMMGNVGAPTGGGPRMMSGMISEKALTTEEEFFVRSRLESIHQNQSRLSTILERIDQMLLKTLPQVITQKLREVRNFVFGYTDVSKFPEAKSTPIMDLKDGDTYDINVSRVKKMIGGSEVAMYAYNGSVPGPTIRTTRGSTIKIRLTNTLGDLDTTLHSHGVRLSEAFDGVPSMQGGKTTISGSGNTVEYTIHFPDAGTFWYHPHIRDDIGQGMGLYGNYIVTDTSSGFTTPVNREEYLMLSDILINRGQVAPFQKDVTDHAIMGRYGNTLLVNGTDTYSLDAKQGEVTRLYLTNAASARTFNFAIPGAQIKLVGSDSGKYTQETFVDSLIIGPSERYVVEVYFPKAGKYLITHITPNKTYTIGLVQVSREQTDKDYSALFETLKTNTEVALEMSKFESYYAKKADKNIAFSLNMMGMGSMGNMMG